MENIENKNEVISLPIEEYRLPIYKEWDKRGYKCPKNKDGWIAYHKVLLLQKLEENR